MVYTKIIAGAVVALPIAAFAFVGSSATPLLANVALAGYGQTKVQICKNGKTLTVAAPSVPAHLKNGATLGPCVL